MTQTTQEPTGKIDFSAPKFARRRIHRRLKDQWATGGIALGGVSVIIAILLIFIYLLVEVVPLFKGGSIEQQAEYAVPAVNPDAQTLFLTTEEQAQIGLRVTDQGELIFFSTADGAVLLENQLELPEAVTVSSFARGAIASDLLAFGLSNGSVMLVEPDYKVTYPNDERVITPLVAYPYGRDALQLDLRGQPLTELALHDDSSGLLLVATTDGGQIDGIQFEKEENFLTGDVQLVPTSLEFPIASRTVTSLAIDNTQRWIFALDDASQVAIYELGRNKVSFHSLVKLAKGQQVRQFQFLLGGISLLIGTDKGDLSQWFLVRDEAGERQLNHIRDFEPMQGAVTAIEPEHRRKGFLTATDRGELGIYYSTGNRQVLEEKITDTAINTLGIAPRANAVLVEDTNGRMHFYQIDNEHPEISWSALWSKVWYENYQQPDYVWQSSAASNDFEPKLSLMPLTFGTIKAAFYAMLVAAPLAICGAIFTAHFMAAPMRRKVKPVIELMEALPTVILGFLAGLWLAPYIETNLPGIFSLLLLMPIGILLVSFIWVQLPGRIRHLVPEGWEAALLVPIVLLIGAGCLLMSEPLELAFFGGDMRSWLTNSAGISFDQRNSLVVGLAMGFAVIPTIFSIAEDAIFSVPKHLSNGSLALGATQWQTLTRVVLLTASPGIFSALMIGFGRAVGETMIVLMATGNTPIMDWNIFEGMRTLAANIAVEMPESEVGSTHFRVLFLAGLVLFSFTFIVNTLAEVVRQRLRRRYGSL